MEQPLFRYCIECQRICIVLDEKNPYHFNAVTSSNDVDLMNCYGPFTYSTPPVVPENWSEFVQEPDPEELALIDANAEFWLQDYLNAII